MTSPTLARAFWPVLFALVVAGLARSWIATSRDGLQIDEAWHVVAGVSYARHGDFRLNPEHPPLVKLFIGASLPPSVFELAPFRPLDDKADERKFIDDVFYLDNDPRAVQARIRVAMLVFHGVLFGLLGVSLRRLFGPLVALFGAGLLLIDPTVAAHLPVVLTDLPLALTSAIAVSWAIVAFRSYRPLDLGIAALALGVALASKHSAIAVGIAVALIGVWFVWKDREHPPAIGRRIASVAGVLLGAYLVLWAFYGFRFAESPGVARLDAPLLFNRSMDDKLADLQSPGYRAILTYAHDLRALPRAYLWGLADTIRAGIEGRQEITYVFGKRLLGETPWYFFPAVLAVKLPLGSIALAFAGLYLLIRWRVEDAYRVPAIALVVWAVVFMVTIMRGNSGYAGVRHVLPVFPVLAVLSAVSIAAAIRSQKNALRWVTGGALAATAITSLPLMRPWEYYNELATGTSGAWRYFNDDGLDNGQRGREIAEYYAKHLRGTGERVYDFYGLFENEIKAYGLEITPLEDPNDADTLDGTIFVNTRWLAPRPTYDYGVFRDAKPAARFGNLLVFRGSYRVPWLRADRRIERVREALSPGSRNPELAEQLLREVIEIYPEDYQAAFELGNLLVERGETEPAIRAYALSRAHAPEGDGLIAQLSRQIDALEREGAGQVGPLRNPWLE